MKECFVTTPAADQNRSLPNTSVRAENERQARARISERGKFPAHPESEPSLSLVLGVNRTTVNNPRDHVLWIL
jgi:hypothetical protein